MKLFSTYIAVTLITAGLMTPSATQAADRLSKSKSSNEAIPNEQLDHKIHVTNYLAEAKVKKIATDCDSASASSCLNHFERYYRGNQDHHKKGGLLGILGGEHFWGAAEELHYTQIEYFYQNKLYELQTGFGYQVAARQAKATMQGTGLVAGLPKEISASTGGTRYWAMIIGIAPDLMLRTKDGETGTQPAESCDEPDELTPESGLVCAIDMQPAVTDAYFRENTARLALAMDRWRRNFAKNDKRLRSLCPQIINFREKDKPLAPQPVADQGMFDLIERLNGILSASCKTKRPNLKIVYRDQEATASWEGKDASLGDSSISQEYDRFGFFFTRTAKARPFAKTYTNPPSDHWFIIKMDGTSRKAKLPSILSSIVTYEQSDVSQHLTVKVYCSGGATATAVAENPVANAIAYTQVVQRARNVVDSNGSVCPEYVSSQ